MTNARMIEYRITRDLLHRRESASHRLVTDRIIRGLALAAGLAVIGLVVPQLILPIFLASMVVTLGL